MSLHRICGMNGMKKTQKQPGASRRRLCRRDQRLEWSRAHIEPDTCRDYDEARYAAFIPRDDARLMCLVFTPRSGKLRVISYRKGNNWEKKICSALMETA